jgi:D-3-phosphoglycerate dehydrogenase
MIRILIAGDFSTRIIDKLNEIPEFEIIEKTNLIPEELAAEIKNVDAVVVSGSTLLTSAVLKGANSLKIIVVTGGGPSHVDTATTRRKNIEIRNTPLFPTPHSCTPTSENLEREGLDVIAILKEFFNV